MINNKLSPTGNSNLTTDITDEQVALYVYYLVDDETVKKKKKKKRVLDMILIFLVGLLIVQRTVEVMHLQV